MTNETEGPGPLVLYHGACADGFASAWCAWLHFGDAAEYVPAQHGEPAPDVAPGRPVYLLDFCYPLEGLRRLAARGPLTVLDHHKTTHDALTGRTSEFPGRGDVLVRFDLKKSGGRLAWEHFRPGESAPWLVAYTEDRDLWLWRLPHSREVNAALRSYPFDFARWRVWADNPGYPRWLIPEGAAILRYQEEVVANHVRFAREVELDRQRVLAVNCTTLQSEVGEKLAEGRPFGVTWFRRADGKYVYSLRSRQGGADVSAVAKPRGGGGHPAAAGFVAAVLLF